MKVKKHNMLRKKKNKLTIHNNEDVEIPIIFDIIPPNQNVDGWCYNPNKPNAKIIIETKLLKRRKLNVIIEEITHAFFWDLPEYKVRKFSAELGKVIYSLFIKKQRKS